MDAHSMLYLVITALGASLILVPLCSKLGLGSVLGYLLAGVLLGPSVFGVVTHVETLMHFAEFGVVLLMFILGLELNPKKLWTMRSAIFVMGAMQVVGCIAALFVFFHFFGFPKWAGLIAAMGFSLSSTALALQILKERRLMDTSAGQNSFSVLLFQDMAVIPMLLLVTYLSPTAVGTDSSGWLSALKPLAAIAGIVFVGRLIVPPIFRLIASTGLREVFTALALFLVLGIAALMQNVGLSMGLGTFLAGVLLAESEYRHELEIDIEPFKGLLLGLFFMASGMAIDLKIIAQNIGLILGMVGIIVAFKMIVLAALARRCEMTARDTSIYAIVLSQGGEFAFVLFTAAVGAQVLSPDQGKILAGALALSMVTTPFLMIAYDKWFEPKVLSRRNVRQHDKIENEDNPVILAGFGRMGQVVARFFHAQNIGTTILEKDPEQVESLRKFGWKTYYGDVARMDLLEAAGAKKAKLLILAIDDMETAIQVTDLVKEHFPNLKIVARASTRPDAWEFMHRDIPVVRELFEGGLELGEKAMLALGCRPYVVKKLANRFRTIDSKLMEESAKLRGDTRSLVSLAKVQREALVRLMEADENQIKSNPSTGWSFVTDSEGEVLANTNPLNS